jgi:arginine-tRNA-protein transferase
MLKIRKHPFLYLGYWIAKSRKMAYKAGFQPLQKLGPAGWVSVEPTG